MLTITSIQHFIVSSYQALTFSLCSRDDVGSKMRKKIEDVLAAGAPEDVSGQQRNGSASQTFRDLNVVIGDAGAEFGSRNESYMPAVYYNKSPDFEKIHGLYCTDVGYMVNAPIFHINNDDPEAVMLVANFATKCRATWHRDVVIDLMGYRR